MTPSPADGRRDAAVIGAALGVLFAVECWVLGLFHLVELPDEVVLVPCMAAGIALWTLGRRSVLWWLLATLAIAIVCIGETPLMRGPMRRLRRSDLIPAHVDAIVVLNGGITQDGLLAPASLDRLLGGLALVRRGLARTLIVTEPRSREAVDADVRRVAALVPEADLVPLVGARSTREEAVRIAMLAAQRRIASIALVTSPPHTRRACATFEHVGLLVTCVPAEDRSDALRTLARPRDRLLAFRYWLYESLGMLKYRMEGWVAEPATPHFPNAVTHN